MKYLQHTLNQSMKLLMVAFAVVTGSLFVSSCALNPFASKAADATAVAPAESGIIQKSQSKKLFGVLPVYRADVQQGNFVSKEMVSQLKVGMTPEQVRFVMGTPLLTDIFHGQRWDYPFRMRRGDGQITTSHVSVFFNEGRVERFEGGDLPQEKDYLDQLAIPKK
ncbi:MAG: outer membrane protein assembly factor BamE [Oxalobacteraceae bacterium]|jgi:outer membrane protein assembly factor BamE|nr:outer membrane protein assembly factor BamE [Oxalobacteraceae bacterium]